MQNNQKKIPTKIFISKIKLFPNVAGFPPPSKRLLITALITQLKFIPFQLMNACIICRHVKDIGFHIFVS